jgi:hypothetical protein
VIVHRPGGIALPLASTVLRKTRFKVCKANMLSLRPLGAGEMSSDLVVRRGGRGRRRRCSCFVSPKLDAGEFEPDRGCEPAIACQTSAE